MPIHTRIQNRRLAIDISQAELAQRLVLLGLKFDKAKVSKTENDRREVPAVEIPFLAEALECEITDLFDPVTEHPQFAVPTSAARGFSPTTRAKELHDRIAIVAKAANKGNDLTRQQQIDLISAAVASGEMTSIDAIPLLRKLKRPEHHQRRSHRKHRE